MANQGRPVLHRRFLIPLGFVVLCAVLVGAYWMVYLRGSVGTDDAFVDGDPTSIASKVLGRITLLACAEGDSVQPDQVLVQLGDSDIRAQMEQAEAAVGLAQRSVALAQVNVQKAQEDFDRAATQFRGGIVTREEYDHARRALDLAQAQARVAQAQETNAEAQLAVVRTQLQNTTITAPAGGVVARRWVMVGDVVQPGQVIYTIYDLRRLWITANFEETKLRSIHVGSPAEITLSAYSGRSFAGRVSLIGAAAASEFSLIPPNNASGNFTKVTQRVPVKIEFADPAAASPPPGGDGNPTTAERLLPGMSAEVKIRVQG
jgi:membrane fusion protein (multidrug efflux system)